MNRIARFLDKVNEVQGSGIACHRKQMEAVQTCTGRELRDRQFELMNRQFAAVGGLVDGDTLVGQLRERWDQPIARLARAIVDRRVVSFHRDSRWVLPMFQFDRSTMVVLEPVTQVIAELAPVFDEWELALWFAEPNAWLDGHSPAALTGSDPRAVHHAARADRFIACS